MSVYIDRKYLLLVANRLDRFSKKKDDLFNFRCPFCGDSEKNKFKARGFIYKRDGNYFYTCHNCGTGHNFYNFLKFVDPSVLPQYTIDNFQDKNFLEKPKNLKKIEKDDKNVQIDLPTIDSLDDAHFAKKYVKNRQIPIKFYQKLFFANDFKAFVNQISDEKININENDQRLVIPFYNSKGNLIYLQGRSFSDSKLRYITISVDKNYPKIFGLERVNFNKKVYVFEGPIDSMFIDNSIATADSDLRKIKNLKTNNFVLVFDNQPRNKEIVRKIEQAIENDYAVCLMPENIQQKDINDMILSGKTSQEIQQIIDEHTFSGLQAKLEFTQWRKI